MSKYHIRGEQDYEQYRKPEAGEEAPQFTPALRTDRNGGYSYRIHTSRAKLSVSVLIDVALIQTERNYHIGQIVVSRRLFPIDWAML